MSPFFTVQAGPPKRRRLRVGGSDHNKSPETPALDRPGMPAAPSRQGRRPPRVLPNVIVQAPTVGRRRHAWQHCAACWPVHRVRRACAPNIPRPLAPWVRGPPRPPAMAQSARRAVHTGRRRTAVHPLQCLSKAPFKPRGAAWAPIAHARDRCETGRDRLLLFSLQVSCPAPPCSLCSSALSFMSFPLRYHAHPAPTTMTSLCAASRGPVGAMASRPTGARPPVSSSLLTPLRAPRCTPCRVASIERPQRLDSASLDPLAGAMSTEDHVPGQVRD